MPAGGTLLPVPRGVRSLGPKEYLKEFTLCWTLSLVRSTLSFYIMDSYFLTQTSEATHSVIYFVVSPLLTAWGYFLHFEIKLDLRLFQLQRCLCETHSNVALTHDLALAVDLS